MAAFIHIMVKWSYAATRSIRLEELLERTADKPAKLKHA